MAAETSSRRVVVAAFIGTMIEWYDFFLYGTAAALIFNKLFFPSLEPLAGTLAAFGTYSAGFVARPLGGVIFGHLGDKVGRKSMLVITLLLMGLATFFIGVLPTYEQIGVAAPCLLVCLRIVQGLALGGEWGGAVLMAVEHSGEGKRGLNASWAQAGAPLGLILGTGAFSACASLPTAQFMSWGWRVPFILGLVLMFVGLFIRTRIQESPLFRQLVAAKAQAKQPLFEVLRFHWKNVLLIIGARIAENASFYVFSVFLLSYATETLRLPRHVALNAVLWGAGVGFFTIPLYGALSDRFGRRPVYLAGALFLGLFAFPFFALVDTRQPLLMHLAVIIATAVGHAAMYAPQAAFFSELFHTRVRFSGASLGYQLSAPLAGGVAPVICTLLLKMGGGESWLISLYLVVLCVVTFGCVLALSETHRSSLGPEPRIAAREEMLKAKD